MRLKTWLMVATFIGLAGCGGGGGGSSSSSTSTGGTATSTACGATAPAAPVSGQANYQSLAVTTTLGGNFFNILTTTIKICESGNAGNCQTIPNVQVDTGSTGLRVVESVIHGMNLPEETSNGTAPYAECAAFADGVVWGTLAAVDIYLGNGLVASNVNMQVIPALNGSNQSTVSTYPSPPSACTGQGGTENNISQLGANGIIGVGLFLADCSAACVNTLTPAPQYFTCPQQSNAANNTCTISAIPQANVINNPVASLPAAYNNGVVIEMNPVSTSGSPSASGSLLFGIGSTGNNSLASSTPVLTVETATDAEPGVFNVSYNGTSGQPGFFDSGSSAYFFSNSSIGTCSTNTSYFCPNALETQELTITALNNTAGTLFFQLGNADSIFSQAGADYAFNDIGAPINTTSISGFDIGLPFFFGQTVYTGLESNASGPYFACTGTPV